VQALRCDDDEQVCLKSAKEITIPTLWKAAVGHDRLNDLNCIVFEIEVDLHETNAALLVSALGDRLLKVGIEAEHLLALKSRKKIPGVKRSTIKE
jgi:hypothetical protein